MDAFLGVDFQALVALADPVELERLQAARVSEVVRRRGFANQCQAAAELRPEQTAALQALQANLDRVYRLREDGSRGWRMWARALQAVARERIDRRRAELRLENVERFAFASQGANTVQLWRAHELLLLFNMLGMMSGQRVQVRLYDECDNTPFRGMVQVRDAYAMAFIRTDRPGRAVQVLREIVAAGTRGELDLCETQALNFLGDAYMQLARLLHRLRRAMVGYASAVAKYSPVSWSVFEAMLRAAEPQTCLAPEQLDRSQNVALQLDSHATAARRSACEA